MKNVDLTRKNSSNTANADKIIDQSLDYGEDKKAEAGVPPRSERVRQEKIATIAEALYTAEEPLLRESIQEDVVFFYQSLPDNYVDDELKAGYVFGFAPGQTRAGDVLCSLEGSKVLIILRKYGDKYWFIGRAVDLPSQHYSKYQQRFANKVMRGHRSYEYLLYRPQLLWTYPLCKSWPCSPTKRFEIHDVCW